MLNNLKKLLIPRKGSAAVDDLDTNWRAIERWANALAQSGFTPYASLTGPGETTTPGALTQQGNLTVDGSFTDNISGSESFVVNFAGPSPAFEANASSGAVAVIGQRSIGASLTCAGSSPPFVTVINNEVDIGVGAGIPGAIQVLAGPEVWLIPTGSGILKFFGTSAGSNQISVIGSRGGNFALASLLTALATYGLIIDNTTP